MELDSYLGHTNGTLATTRVETQGWLVHCGRVWGPACLQRRVQLLGLVPFAGCAKLKLGISTRFFSAKMKLGLGECSFFPIL